MCEKIFAAQPFNGRAYCLGGHNDSRKPILPKMELSKMWPRNVFII